MGFSFFCCAATKEALRFATVKNKSFTPSPVRAEAKCKDASHSVHIARHSSKLKLRARGISVLLPATPITTPGSAYV